MRALILLSFRRLRRAPGFTLAAVLLLGVGVGLGIPFFNIINTAVLKPAAAGRDYVRVVVNGWAGYTLHDAEIEAVRSMPPGSFVALIGSGIARTTTVVNGISLRANVEGVLGPYFAEFPVVPILGRLLTADDERDRQDVAVISERLWQVAFSGRADAIGASATLAGQRVTIVGVVPGIYGGAPAPNLPLRRDAWVPAHIVSPETLFGRIAAGATVARADAEVGMRSMPRGEAANSRVLGVRDGFGIGLGNLRFSEYSFTLVVLAIGIAISLVAAGSFSLLVFARLLSGQADLSIRLALGATARDLTRLVACEAGLLALGATMVAVWVGTLLSHLVLAQFVGASGIAIAPDLSPDWRLIGYTALTTFGAVALVVARLAWNLRSLEALGSMVATSGVGGSTQRTTSETNRLVIAQTAVSTGLLLLTVMLGRTIVAGVDPSQGLDVDRSAVAWLDHGVLPYAPDDAARVIGRAVDVTRDTPGVVSAAAITTLPGDPDRYSASISPGPTSAPSSAAAHYVTGSVFDVLQRPVVRGRTFSSDEDRSSGDVVIVSTTVATRFWSVDDAAGRRLWVRMNDGDRRPFVVVGVAADAADGADGRGDVYFPVAHRPSWLSVGIVARAHDDGAQLAARVRDAYRTELPDTGFLHVRSMREELDEQLGAATFWARMYGTLGVLVFIVAMGGLYGLSAHLAALRRREIGIRRALGATTAMLCRMLHHEHSRMLVMGVGIGCVGGLFLASLILRHFPTLRLWDPLSLIIVAAVLYAAGLTGALAPFVRTMRDAVVQLRE